MTSVTVSPFGAHIGFEIVEMAHKRATVRIEVTERHHNTAGIVHGGVISALIDHAAGAAALSAMDEAHYAVGTRLEVEFSRPIRTGSVTCEAEVESSSEEPGRLQVAAVVASSGMICAEGRVEFVLRSRESIRRTPSG